MLNLHSLRVFYCLVHLHPHVITVKQNPCPGKLSYLSGDGAILIPGNEYYMNMINCLQRNSMNNAASLPSTVPAIQVASGNNDIRTTFPLRRNWYSFLHTFYSGQVFLIFICVIFFRVPVLSQVPELLKDINGSVTLSSETNSGYNFTTLNGAVYFVANDGITGYELWKTDGTPAGTTLVKDINPGINGIATGGAQPLMVAMNGYLYFAASTAANGEELWRSDGTEAGTTLVKDINSGTTGSAPRNLKNINGVLFFTAGQTSSGTELWKSDGTDAGTVLVRDINPGTVSSIPSNLTQVGANVFFTATTATNGTELWMSDGTNAGTVLVKDINAGTTNTTFQNLTAFGNVLIFSASEAVNGQELWRSDGTDAGTLIVKDINPGAASGVTGPFIINGTQFLFTATNALTGTELW